MANKEDIKNFQSRSDLVAYWSVPLLDGVHTVEFEHGTTTGKRVLRLNGKEIYRKDWMFRLVGDVKFTLGKQEAKCELRVDPIPYFCFSYSLYVDGKPLEKFVEKQNQAVKAWSIVENGKRYRIVFDKPVMEIWMNGEIIEPEIDFIEKGTEMIFQIGEAEAKIKSKISPENKEVIYDLFVNNNLIEDDNFNE
ncbi:fas apoptotic inhibitory molecule 1 [Sitophilus oryzae]|uniref:Fas apoptotic inhibitory molecule 1 n=1 Tax=Sitophilus oryzae TaxID=7048 RepID=A0A6J2YST3_SITOR|nr:fas apoptotic inhibitory molecule 1 [Sitophilus oryzae]